MNACSVASWLMVGLVHVRRLEKGNRSDIYWRVIKVCVGSILLEEKKLYMYFGTIVPKYVLVNV